MKIIAVTGSKGKSTTIALLSQAIKDSGQEKEFKIYESFDTPPQVKVDIAIFTNIEHNEHGETFKTFGEYLKKKKSIFDSMSESGLAIVNSDDENYQNMINDCKAKIITYGFNEKADFRLNILSMDRLTMNYAINDEKFCSKILGKHNVYNLSAVFIACLNLGIRFTSINNFEGVPGRFKRVNAINKNLAIIDYAHTENSLKCTLQLIKEIYPDKNIITVFGCGGDRDKSKRPLMGKVACLYSKRVILTGDNSRGEKVENITCEILKGCEVLKTKIELDRTKAICMAIRENEDSIILIAGMGVELNHVKNNLITDEGIVLSTI